MSNFVCLTRPSFQILDKTQTGISDFRISCQTPYKLNCRTSTDIDMKFGPITNFEKKNMTTPKNLWSQLMVNLKQSGSRFWMTGL